jgi:putative intracellular protease/amidase
MATPERRAGLAHVVPPVGLALLVLLPVLLGDETFFLRDLFGAHLGLRHSVAVGLAEGHLPLLDSLRLGQPLAGNPNAVAFHPTALLHLVAPLFAAFNAHLWLHFLAAPFAMAWLARELGLARRAAWAAGVCFGFSGYLASQLAFFNLIGGVATAPALAAALLATVRRARAGAPGAAAACAAAGGLLWALEVLAGDPLTAAMAAALTAAVVLPALLAPGRAVAGRGRALAAGLVAAAVVAGSLVALPQIVEFLRILPSSARGRLGFLTAVRTAASLDPRQGVDWLLPFAFGRPDLLGPGSFWGARYYQGSWAFYFTLYPGLLAPALVAAAARGGRRPAVAGLGWGLAAAGLFLALGRFNPLTAWLLALPALDVLRYPLKFWFFAAVGLSLLCGLGFERAVVAGEPAARRRAAGILAAAAGGGAALWAALRLWPGAAAAAFHARMEAVAPASYGPFEVERWSGLALLSVAVAVAAVALLAAARRWPAAAGAALLAFHAGTQLLFLHPAMATDAVLPYRLPSRLLSALPAEDIVVHGSDQGLFGPRTVEGGVFPAPEARWIFRRAAHEAYPMAGQLFGRRYDLNTTPEALDPVPVRWAVTAVEHAAGDRERLRLLAAWGVGRLVTSREIAAADLAGLAEPAASAPSFRQRVWVYRLTGAAPEVYLAARVLPVRHERHAAEALLRADFRPGRDAVVVSPGPAGGAPGPRRVEVTARGTESLTARVAAAGPSLLVWRRSWVPLYRATVDGRPVRPVAANLHRLGVPVPPGEHEVRLWVDRRPLAWSLAAAGLGAAGLLGLLVAALALSRPPRAS